jgi:hypothetical protein
VIGRTSTPRRPSPDLGVARVAWDDGLGADFLARWGRPDGRYDPEHLTVYGKSGGGKTYFVGYVLQERARCRGSHVVVVATKRADSTLTRLGWPIISTWPPGYGENQVIYWARAKGITAEHRVPQRAAIKRLMDRLWVPGSNVIVYWDELTYLEQDLRLKTEIATFYREGRTLGITNVASMQRPAGVSRLAHSEAGWTVVFPPKDQDDRKRVAEVLGDRQRFGLILDSLDRGKYEFLIRHDRSGETYISHLPRPSRETRVRQRAATGRMGYGVRSARQ